MKHRHLGHSGLVVSRLALGTMTWGRDTDEDDAAAQLIAFREAGGTLVDTADTYVAGDSERVLGRLLRDVVPRDEVLVATKAWGVTGPGPMGRGASRGHLLSALDASLERLGVDHVDLWQLHAWDQVTPWEETFAALDAAVQSGRVRYVGVSNFGGWQLGTTATWQRAVPGRAPVVSDQVEYSLLQRGIEREVVPAALVHEVGLLPWSPLGRGVLTGKYRNGPPADSRGASEHFTSFVQPYLDARSASIVDAVLTAADGLGVSPVAVALAWVRDRPGVVAPIVGARTSAQLQASLAAEDVQLPDEIRAALDDVSAPGKGYPENAFQWTSEDLED
ncbi:MAG TPA: aldo/keto reductase [Mycobacteriales bacterium]|nr:aldo/keto reductase [Mycobacteriales bacterium]